MRINKKWIGFGTLMALSFFLFKLDVHLLNLINSLSRSSWIDLHVGENLCELREGSFLTIGTPIGLHDSEEVSQCFLPYSDGGEACSSSRDCNGECIVLEPSLSGYFDERKNLQLDNPSCKTERYLNEYYCSDVDFVAQCQEIPHNRCEKGRYWILVDEQTVRRSYDSCYPPT